MNWKGEAIEKLRKYDAMRMSLQNIPMEMKRLEADAQSIRGARTDGTPVKGGGSGREDALLNNLAHRQELSWALDQARYWVEITQRAWIPLPRRNGWCSTGFTCTRSGEAWSGCAWSWGWSSPVSTGSGTKPSTSLPWPCTARSRPKLGKKREDFCKKMWYHRYTEIRIPEGGRGNTAPFL